MAKSVANLRQHTNWIYKEDVFETIRDSCRGGRHFGRHPEKPRVIPNPVRRKFRHFMSEFWYGQTYYLIMVRKYRNQQYDKIIIGLVFTVYILLYIAAEKDRKYLFLNVTPHHFDVLTYINQARVHHGYHYPRSISTALKSAEYFERFNRDFDFCINREFKKVYATSAQYSWTSGEQFKKFCKAINIPCEELKPSAFFKDGICDGAFLTREYTYDANILKDWYLQKLFELKNVQIKYCARIERIENSTCAYKLILDDGTKYETSYLLNATYAATNQILDMLGLEKFGIKYELCEIILCNVNEKLSEYGFTVMDGPFFL